MQYRRDIDGLRTVAVVPVVIYHAGYGLFPGGFVGVDIFFVISGYLITKLIAEQIEGGAFSFTQFYVRRVRRLLPALVGVSAFTFWLSWTYFSPQDFTEYLYSLIGMLTFSNNFVFLWQADYFAEASATKPLLHTWSLAVEEQFYLIVPALLFFMIRRAGRDLAIKVFAIIGAISFLAAMILMDNDMAAQAFFNSGVRFWEMIVGSLIALGSLSARTPAQATALRWGGLAMIAYAVLAFDHDTAFPGLTAVLPVLGTAAIICAGPIGSDLIKQALETRLFVYIGKISYSLYLWHWPLLVACHFLAPGEFWAPMIAVVLSFGAASVSYHLIETPLRFGPVLKTPVRAFSFLAVVSLSGLGPALYLHQADAANSRFSGDRALAMQLLDTKEAQKTWRWERDACEDRIPGLPRNLSSCLTIASPDDPTILIIGDSHGQHLLHGIQQRWTEANVIGIMGGGCKPIRGWTEDRDNCDIIREFLFETYAGWDQVDVVVVAFRTNEKHVDGLIDTVNWLREKDGPKVVVIGSLPEYDPPFDDFFTASATSSFQEIAEAAQNNLSDRPSEVSKQIRDMLPRDVVFIESIEIVCSNSNCRVFDRQNRPIILDYGHLTPPGSIWFVSQWPNLLSGE